MKNPARPIVKRVVGSWRDTLSYIRRGRAVTRVSAWCWTLYGANGERLAHSEVYSSKAKMRQTARAVAKQLGARYSEVSRKP